MKTSSTVFVAFLLLVAIAILPAMGAQAIRVVTDVSNETAAFSVNSGSAAATLDLQLSTVGVRDVMLSGHPYKALDLPAGDHLVPASLNEDGRPDVPVMTSNIIIPDDAGIRLSVTYSGYDDIPDIDLAPVQPSPVDRSDGPPPPIPFTIDQQAYSIDAFYPSDLAFASEPQIMRDVRFAQITICPAQYNPVQRVLRIYHDVSVAINYDGEVINPRTIHHRYVSEGFYPIYKAMFANFDEFLANAEVRRGGYVIICKPALVDSCKAVARWKHQKGYYVRIVPTTQITPNGSPIKDSIFAYIQRAYRTWEIPPEYVMIIGDVDGTFGVNDWPYTSYPSDNHFGCVDGTDYIPDIFIGRMSVSTMADVRISLSKIIKYEKYPYMTDPQHWIRGLSVGDVYYESARLTTLWVREIEMQHGFVHVDTLYGSYYDARIMTYLNAGVGFTQYRGAGGSEGWTGPSLDVNNLQSMTNNNKLGVMSPLTCGTGDFGYAQCFGEKWIRMGLNPDSLKGGPAFYGVSEHDTHARFNNPIMVGYFFGIFHEDINHIGAAAVRGKLQDYWTFPAELGPGGWIERYFNTYNILGDPELELRTKIPMGLTVTHPDTINLGTNHVDATVADTAGHLIPNAYVTLIKTVDTTEVVYSVGKTDASGNVTLAFDDRSTGPMTLTVSGENLIPVQSTVQVVNSDLTVGLDSISVDDDANGHSNGDGDGIAAPGETIELDTWIKNFAIIYSAIDVNAQLESLDGASVVYDGNSNYGNISPGQTQPPTKPFVIGINPEANDGDMARLSITLTDQNQHSWQAIVDIPIEAPKFVVSRVRVPEGDTVMSPGETSNLEIFLTNRGAINAQNVSATVTTEDDYATILSSNTNFGDIPADSTCNNLTSLISLKCDSSTFEGRKINLILHTTTAAGAKATIPFTLTVGTISRNDPVGPDAYGYYMFDTKDSAYAMMPTYQWTEISPDSGGGHGSRLNYGSNLDDNSVLVTIPSDFNFTYYGERHGVMIVCINGFAALDTFRMDSGGHYWANFFNWPMPDPGNASGQISPFWDDLSIVGSHYGVYTWDDTTNHKFYIEWLRMTNNNVTGYYETFQMVITDPAYYPTMTGDSEIHFLYRDIHNSDATNAYASVGFESPEEERGLGFTQDNRYTPGAATLANNMVYRITTNTGRGAIKGVADLNNGGNNGGVQIHTTTGQVKSTDANGNFWIREVPPETVGVIAEMRGYFPASFDSVIVIANHTLQLDTLHLSPCPVPTNLSATDNLSDRIEVRWDSLSHANLIGYNIYRSRWSNGEFTKLNTSPIQNRLFIDTTPSDTSLYWYCVSAVFSVHNSTAESFDSNKDSGKLLNPTSIDEPVLAPKEFYLSQNYPNPFNPTTTISYGLPVASHVKIDIFNIMGQKVLDLVDEEQTAGFKQVIWNGKDNSGEAVSSGLYFYRIDTKGFVQTKKMLMLK
jgi:hypothetical protein